MYIGRFAPSPTGPLHAGSLVAALASWLDARAHGGRWLVRIEDVDAPRCVPGADALILQQLARCGLHPDAPPTWQSQRGAAYQAALDHLVAAGLAYPCACSRQEVAAAQAAAGITRQRGRELPYPGTCRPERGGLHGRAPRAWRLHTVRCEQRWLVEGSTAVAPHPCLSPEGRGQSALPVLPPLAVGEGGSEGAPRDSRNGEFEQNQPPARIHPAQTAITSEAPTTIIHWHDRRLGAQQQHLSAEVGDFVLKRADGLWAYQLAVVVDDAAQGITHVVRGADLTDNTPRQIALQRAMGLPTPSYLHTPLVLGPDGEKLSKQNGAQALDLHDPSQALREAARHLSLDSNRNPHRVNELLASWIAAWQARYG